MSILELRRRLSAFLTLTLMAMALTLLPACSSTSESDDGSSNGGGEDCSMYTNEVDIKECEVRNEMRQ